MSTTTTNFSLFKYDPSTDGNTSFSITNALNNNWDKLDANCVRRLSTTAASGSATQPVYVDAQGKIQTCNAYSTIPSGLTATTSLAENGYIKFSNKALIQWGTVTATDDAETHKGTYSVTFANTSYSLVLGAMGTTSNDSVHYWNVGYTAKTKSTFTYWANPSYMKHRSYHAIGW